MYCIRLFISTQRERKGRKLRSKESNLEDASPCPVQHAVLSKSDPTHLVGQSAIYTPELEGLDPPQYFRGGDSAFPIINYETRSCIVSY